MKSKKAILPTEHIETLIQVMRGQKVIVDVDLARIYGVETRALNQAVKRNPERFPTDFVFQLTSKETEVWQRSLTRPWDRTQFAKSRFALGQGTSEGVYPARSSTERATKPQGKTALARRVAALLACGFVARRVTERCGYAPFLAPRHKPKSPATNCILSHGLVSKVTICDRIREIEKHPITICDRIETQPSLCPICIHRTRSDDGRQCSQYDPL